MDNLLQGFGVIACLGALILIVMVALVVRAFSARRSNDGGMLGRAPDTDRQAGFGERGALRDRDDDILTRRGSERPTYDSDEVRSSGGFGAAIPNTGGRADRLDDDEERRTLHSYDQPGRGPLRDLDVDDAGNELPPRRRRSDDDIESGGGFGGR